MSAPYRSSFAGPMPFTRSSAVSVEGRAAAIAASVSSEATTYAGFSSCRARPERRLTSSAG